MDSLNDWNKLKCGLIYIIEDRQVPVPLKKVQLDVKVVDFIAQVSVIQEYVNQENNPIEVHYSYPVEESAAIIGFEATIDGHEIVAEVKEKEEAKAEYDQAMRQGNSAILLDETAPDIFSMKLGQLKAGAGAQVKLTYIMELPVEDKATRLTIPTTIAPRYVPPTDESSAAKEIAKIGYKSSFDPKTPLHIQIKTIMKGKIKSITSPTHDLDVQINVDPDENGQFNANANLKEATTDVMNRDLVVLFKVEDNDKPMVFLEKSGESLAAMVSLIPSFKLEEQKTELIFLVDRSGSMMGESIDMAKKALKIFLHSLPVDCYFNIVSFGSRFSYLFEKGSNIYDDHSLEKAKAHVEKMEANYGGTEIHAPLKSIFSQSPIQGYARQIFLLTDGAVSNDNQIIKLVRSNNKSSRVFTLGLGSSASRHLVKGVARAGNGTSIFSNLNEDLRPKVVALLKNALMPALTDLKILWNGIDNNVNAKESEKKPKEQVRTLLGYNTSTSEDDQTVPDGNQSEVLYDGARMLNFRLFAKYETLEKVVIVAQAPDGPLSVTIPITEKDHLEGGCFVHQMAARRRIQKIEDSLPFDEYELPEHAKKEITGLGRKFGLATKYTSFIGVDKQSKKSLFEGAMQSRHIEHEIPHMMFGGGGPMAMACMMAPPMMAPPMMAPPMMAPPMMADLMIAAPPPPPMCNSMGPMRRSLKKCTEK